MEKMQELLEIIRKGNNNQLEKILHENPKLADANTIEGISLLQFACYCRNSNAIDLLKQKKTSLNIFEAICIGEIEVVKNLLEKDPKRVNSHSHDGFTPLGLAAFFEQLDLVNFLLTKGADPNAAAKNAFKVAPIHSACAVSNYSIAELLLKNGANVNARQLKNVTPLHSAAHNGKLKLAELLIAYKADVNAKTNEGKTPLSMAKEKSFKEVAELIRKHGEI